MTEPDIVLASLKEAERINLEQAKALEQQTQDARSQANIFERDAADARARAIKFRTAITKLGA